MSIKLLEGLGKVLDVLGLILELPNEDGLVSGSRDENLGVLVFLDGVASHDGGDPSIVSNEVTLEGERDGLRISHE